MEDSTDIIEHDNPYAVPTVYNEALAKEMEDLRKRVQITGDKVVIQQDKKFKFPDGRISGDPFEVIVVEYALQNNLWPPMFNRNDITPPECWSVALSEAEQAPSPNAFSPQAVSCKACPKNQWGSDPGGGRGRACKNSHVLAFLPPEPEMDSPIWTMRTNPSSIKYFSKYASTVLTKFGLPLKALVTRIKFSSDTWASVDFEAVSRLSPEKVSIVLARADEAKQLALADPNYTKSS